MNRVFTEIIAEFHQEPIPKPLARDISLPTLPTNLRKAFVYIGMRRSGKTYALYQRIHELLQQGISKEKILYINFEDDRLNCMTVQDFQSILDAYWELYPDYAHSNDIYFFFDEIAEIDSWESFIRRLLDKETMQLYLSGSSAKMLSKEIATSLRGRTITREVFPMSFIEYLSAKSISASYKSSKQKSLVNHHLLNYLAQGGFPETLEVSTSLRRELIQSYMDSVIYRDIIERHDVKNHIALRQFLLCCLQSPTGLLSINKLFNQFKTRGISVSKDSLYQYLDYFEDAYCLFTVPVYSFALNKSSLKPKKVYPIDNGVASAYALKPANYQQAEWLEIAVFLHLRRQGLEIHYYQTKTGKQVDFLTVAVSGQLALYQVCLSLKNAQTRDRELEALTQAMDETDLKYATVITLTEAEQITMDNKKITLLPLAELLL